jgi:hypothetical protein
MKFLCMGFHDEKVWNQQPAEEREALLNDTFAYADELRRKGHVIGDEALQEARTAATLRFGKSGVSVTDGPYAETKEQLGGFMLIEADDLNHAIRLMSKIPCMRMGGAIEIRPVNEEMNEAVRAGVVPAAVGR